MLEKLSILRQAWQQPDNKRAMGGIHALSGFDYQFAIFLRSVINRIYNAIKNDELPPLSDSLCTEAISDITELTPEGLLYITQVKLRANVEFGKIFSEFWEIFELAKHVIPGDEDKLHFWLCTSVMSSSESDIRAKFRSWAKKEKVSEMTASCLEHRIHAKVVEHPEDQILHILVNQMRDDKPEKHLAEWKGRLLSSSSKGKFDEAVGRIREELIEIANRVNKPEVPIYVWQSTDRPPSDVVHGDVLTGSQPWPRQLREGFFAPRHYVYDDLVEAFTQWRETLSDTTDVSIRMPVFWIGGRSGSGKSVALLHLLANIHSQENVRIFWLQQSIQYLPDAIRWAVSLRKQGYDTIIAADDPFAPATQQKVIQKIGCNVKGKIKKYEKRVNNLSKILKENGFKFQEPKGGFYLFPEIPDIFRDLGDFMNYAHSGYDPLLFVPGPAFSAHGGEKYSRHIRLSGCVSEKESGQN